MINSRLCSSVSLETVLRDRCGARCLFPAAAVEAMAREALRRLGLVDAAAGSDSLTD